MSYITSDDKQEPFTLKNVIFGLAVATVIIGTIGLVFSMIINREHCGTVIELIEDRANFGGTTRKIVMYDDVLKRNIVVGVRDNVFFNAKKGESICVMASNEELKQ